VLKGYWNSAIFKKVNPLTLSFTLPASKTTNTTTSANAKESLKELNAAAKRAGTFLMTLLRAEIKAHGIAFLRKLTGEEFNSQKAAMEQVRLDLKYQFSAFLEGAYPFSSALKHGQTLLHWWKTVSVHPHARVLSVRICSLSRALIYANGPYFRHWRLKYTPSSQTRWPTSVQSRE
jgi:hypothetical protein